MPRVDASANVRQKHHEMLNMVFKNVKQGEREVSQLIKAVFVNKMMEKILSSPQGWFERKEKVFIQVFEHYANITHLPIVIVTFELL